MAAQDVASYAVDELQAMSQRDLDALLGSGRPIDIRFATGRLRGRFGVADGTLRVEVSEIDGGGDAMLMTFSTGCRNLARQRGIGKIEWLVHAAACAAPNRRLQQVLPARGFTLQDVQGVGQAYRRLENIG